MTSRTNRALRTWLRDMLIGAMIFMVIPALAQSLDNREQGWAVSGALAGEAIAARAVEVTAPPGAMAENAIVAAAQLRPFTDPLLWRNMSIAFVLCLTFSLMVAFNMALMRHLRRVNASPRREAGRRRR